MAIYMWREFVLPDYLCFTANTAGSVISLQKNSNPTAVQLEISTDGTTWTDYSTYGTNITLTNVWDKVYWRNKSETTTWFSTSDADSGSFYRFIWSWSIAISWDVTSLLCKNFSTTVSNYCFCNLFNTNSSLFTSAPSIPATTLWYRCYYRMFWWQWNMETLPKLPATTLANECYYHMFYWCSKIKISSTQTWDYQTAYRIPTEWTGTMGSQSTYRMFYYTWWTFTGTPQVNTNYYTSNALV